MKTRAVAQLLTSALALSLTLGMSSVATAFGFIGGGGGGGGATTSVTGTVHTVDVAKRNVTIKTSAGTSVKLSAGRTALTRNGARVTLNGLVLNDTITAQYKVSTLSATSLSATGPAVATTSGKAGSVSLASGTITIGAQKLQTNAGTRISRNGQIVALRQVTLKDSLVVHTTQGTNVALDVVSSGPSEGEVQGVIGAISGSNVTITPDDGTPDVTVVVGTSTIIEVNDASGTLADLAVGDTAEAEYDPTTFAAFSIEAAGESEDAEVEGTAAAVDTTAGTVTVTPQDGGANITLTVNATTEIDVNGDGGSLADIQVGMPIKAEYDTANLLASEIEAGGDDGSDDGSGD